MGVVDTGKKGSKAVLVTIVIIFIILVAMNPATAADFARFLGGLLESGWEFFTEFIGNLVETFETLSNS